MHVVAMKVIGNVFRVEGSPWDYHNGIRASASGIGGLTACEVVLLATDGVVTTKPQPAELHFPRIFQLEDGAEEIDLYDGPKLVMKFRTVKL